MRVKGKAMSKEKKSPKDQTMDRRSVIRGMGALGAATVVAACSEEKSDAGDKGAPAILNQKRSLKMVTSWPKNFPGLGTGANRLAESVKALSDGQIDIKVYAGGELVGALGAFDAVSQGKADMYHSAEYYWQGKSKAYNFFGSVPFGMTAGEMNAWIRFNGGQELWDKLSGGFNVKPLLAGNTGVQMGGWYNRDINNLDDFQGLRIRMPGLGGEVMKRLGATPVTKPGSELFQALSQGNIDATEWIGPWNDMAFGLHTIAKNYYYPGIHEPGTALTLGLNKDLWDDFSEKERIIFETAAAAENDLLLAEYNAKNARGLKTLKDEGKVNILPMPEDILKRMHGEAIQVLSETADADALTKEVYESYRASYDITTAWSAISELAYMKVRES